MIINEKFDAPFVGIPGLRLDKVSRWGIVSMSRHQSVAEHSFNVAIITNHIAVKKNSPFVEKLVYEALLHDHMEEYTGDIPSPAKQEIKSDTHPIVKLADLIESYRYAKMYCNDTPAVKEWLLNGLMSKINIISDKYIMADAILDLIEDVS